MVIKTVLAIALVAFIVGGVVYLRLKERKDNK